MKLTQMLRGFCAFAMLLFCGQVIEGQVLTKAPSWIESVAEPGQGLAVKHVSRETGLATFATSPGKGMLLAVSDGASAEQRALSFVDTYGEAFGLANSSQLRLMRAVHLDELGLEHVRFQQVHQGVPITGGELIVHLKGARAMAANGRIIANLPDNVVPTLSAELAKGAARQLIEKRMRAHGPGAVYSEPRLEILNRTLLTGKGNDFSHLAWFIEATGPELRQYIWVDARSGAILLQFSQLTDAKNRTVYTANNTSSLPGTLVRVEGGAATGNADNDNAYTFAGITYDYFLVNHGRDSFDNAGGEIRSTTHYCPAATCPADYANAFWNGTQMVYGNGYASADDVVGHELTHAVTERTAGLFYYMQSGALNESFSDIFGETIDQGSTVGGGNDTPAVKWAMGEDLLIGAIRNMLNPTLFGDPAKVNDANFKCSTIGWTDPNKTEDHAGVHSNSGVPNHAYALMVDGGTFNSRTITGIGLAKAGKIEFRALSVYLTSGSGFIDDYNALNQSCNDLVGTSGITAGDCIQVMNALDAVEMNLPWGCFGAQQTPAKCPTAGTIPSYTAFSNFEVNLGPWTPSVVTGTGGLPGTGVWYKDFGLARTGQGMATGDDVASTSRIELTMSNTPAVPTGGRLYFDHLFEFENDPVTGEAFDGGRFEYSTDGGVNWFDANPLIDAGHAYDGTLVNPVGATNPLRGLTAYTGASYGYTGTRLNLAGLAGQPIKFRFIIGTDEFVGSLGWLLDNVAIYRCVSSAFTDDPIVIGSTTVKAAHINELRARINSIRVSWNLPIQLFTDGLTPGTTAIKATHITQLRTALASAYTAAGRAVPVYTDPGLGIGTPVRAVHIRELRAAVQAIEIR